MKITASLIILGLCANICYAATPTPTNQANAMSRLWLNGTATQVYSVVNQTDAAIWNQYAQIVALDSPTGVSSFSILFGPGTTNETMYVWGLHLNSDYEFDKIYKRTLNANIIGRGTDTSMECVIKDEVITLPFAADASPAVAPDSPAFLSSVQYKLSTKYTSQSFLIQLRHHISSLQPVNRTQLLEKPTNSALETFGTTKALMLSSIRIAILSLRKLIAIQYQECHTKSILEVTMLMAPPTGPPPCL